MNRSVIGGLLAAVLAVAGCASSTGAADGSGGGDAGGSDVVADRGHADAGSTDAGSTDGSGGDAGCPADPSTAVGTPCAVEGQSCGDCSNPCAFCNPLLCMNGHWTQVEVFPGVCDDAGSVDAGSTDAGSADAGPACGSATCASGEVCVHTVASGGACMQPEDGGCPDGTHLAGDCCVFTSETFQCAARPAGCDATLACGCADALCTNGCTCQGASSEQLECGCFYP